MIIVNIVLLIYLNYFSIINKTISKSYFEFYSINYCFKEDIKYI